MSNDLHDELVEGRVRTLESSCAGLRLLATMNFRVLNCSAAACAQTNL